MLPLALWVEQASPEFGGIELEVQHADHTTTRSVAAYTCDTLSNAIALIIAVGVGPTEVMSTAEPPNPDLEADPQPLDGVVPAEPQPSPTMAHRLVTDAPSSSAASTVPPPTRRRRPPRVLGFVDGGASWGPRPAVGGVLGGGVLLQFGNARLELRGGYDFERPFAPRGSSTAVLTMGGGWGRLSGCGSPSVQRWVFVVCAGFEIGAMTGRGVDLARIDTARSLWLAVVPHARAVWFPHPRVGFGPFVEVPISVTQPAFGIDDLSDAVVRSRQVGVRWGIVLEVDFSRRIPGEGEKSETR